MASHIDEGKATVIYLTATLIAVGAILAALGTLGFTIVWQQAPSHEDLQFTRKLATVGRWLTIPGLCLYAGHYGASGLGLYALMVSVALVVASLITKTTSRAVPAG